MDFTPHGFCLAWEPKLLTVTIIANIGIAIAYWVIPVQLIYYYKKLTNELGSPIPRWITLGFSVFIFLCGTSHIVKVVTLFQPLYWLEAWVDLATMIASLTIAFLFGVALVHVVRAAAFARDNG